MSDKVVDDHRVETIIEQGPPQATEDDADLKLHGSQEQTAHLASQEAHDETIREALTRNPWTIVWLVFNIWNVLCCSFDNNAGGMVLGVPRFRQDFGYLYNGEYTLYAEWQAAFNGGSAACQIFGTFMGSALGDKFGRKWTMLVCYAILAVGITLEVISNSQGNPNLVFFLGKSINGWGVGALQTTAFTYISEVAPLRLRGIFTSAAAVAFCIGTLILAIIIDAYGNLPSSWAYKSLFLTQYGVTGIAVMILPFMPESPLWLISVGKHTQARQSLRKLGQGSDQSQESFAMIHYTLEANATETNAATYMELFRKSNLRRTIIALMPLTIQSFSGVGWVGGYFTYYAQLAGYSTSMSYRLNICQQVLSTTGNVMSWFLIESVGRRPMTLYGMISLTGLLLLAGGLASIGTIAGNKATVALILVYCWLYNMTIGATAFAAMTEVGTSRLRIKTAGFALAMKGCWDVMWSFVLPYLFNPSEANLQAKVTFIFGGFCVLFNVYLYFHHPETKGRSFEELDEMFAKKVPARQFKTYVTAAELRGRELQAQQDAVAPAF